MSTRKPGRQREPRPAARPDEFDRASAMAAALRAVLPQLTEAQRRAFRGLYSDAQCDALGARTKARGVLGDAQRWLAIMHEAQQAHPVDLRRYSIARFAWFVDCVAALARRLAAEKRLGDDAEHDRGVTDIDEEHGRELREDLETALATLAGGDPVQRERVASVRATAESPATLAEALRDLARLAEGWLARKDAESVALVESVNLTAADVVAARAAAVRLDEAGAAPRVNPMLDSPAVNRDEGRVIAEMRVAMRIYEHAHARNKLVPRLIPGAATRHVLGRRAAGEGDKDEGGKPAGEGGAGAGAEEKVAAGGETPAGAGTKAHRKGRRRG